MSKAQGETRPEVGEDKSTGPGEKIERMDKGEKAEGSALAEEPKRPASGGGDLTIYLFGRTGREKEEWFRRFLLASRMKSEGRGGGLPGICKSGESVMYNITPQDSNRHVQRVGVPAHTHTHTYIHFISTDTHRSPQSEYPFS